MRKKIECLDRLFVTLKCRNEILEYLKGEKLITDDVMQHLLHDHHSTHSTKIASLMEELLKAEKLQLVDYSWTILPKEFIQLSIVSKDSKKDFTYSV